MARPPPLPGVSLKRQLLLWLLLPQLVLWLTGGVLAWRVALENGERGIDQSLTQSVKALARQIKPIGDGLLVDFPKAAQDILEQDPADRISYMVSSPPGRFLLGNAQLPPPPADKALAEPGEAVLYAGVVDERPVRVVSLEVDYGSPGSKQRLRVQVAQSLTVRERIAHGPVGAGAQRTGVCRRAARPAPVEAAGGRDRTDRRQPATRPRPPAQRGPEHGPPGGAFAGQHHQPPAGRGGQRPGQGETVSQRRRPPAAHPLGWPDRADRSGPARDARLPRPRAPDQGACRGPAQRAPGAPIAATGPFRDHGGAAAAGPAGPGPRGGARLDDPGPGRGCGSGLRG